MSTGIGKSLKAALRFVAGIGPKLTSLTADEQTRRSWAKTLKSFDEVPDAYKDFLETLPGGARPYMVLTPSYEGFISRTNERLLCCLGDKVFIAEKQRDAVTSTCYSFKDINYVEVGTILLKSWIKISGVTGNGVLTSSTLRFNSVTEHMFTPLLKGIRPAAHDAEGADLSSERAKFDYLKKLNFKFMNFARRSILPGEKVLQTILQPKIRAQVFNFLGIPFSRTLSPAHITILTDKELITIRDEATKLWEKSVEYGGIWNYIPLHKITSVSLAQREDNLLVLSIHLPENDRIDALFAPSNEHEIRLLQEQLESLMPGSTAGHAVSVPGAA